jgi:hypothetical protein
MTTEPIFDIRKQVYIRTLEHMLVLPIIGFTLIGLGSWLLPNNFVWELSIRAVENSGVWVFVGLGLIAAGIYNILKVVILSLRSINSSGEWHFRLTKDELLWKVPQHPFGPEVGFETKLSDIKEVEFRTITAFGESDKREYWVHFTDGAKIQLKGYTGYALSWLVSEIHKAGVHYKETLMNR